MQLPFSAIGDVQLTHLLYSGPYNLVALGYQSALQRRVLVKLLRPGIDGQEERIRRFQKEARACARLKHPHIVGVHALGEEYGYHYIVLEYVDGLNLAELLIHAGPLALPQLLLLTEEILQALRYAHQEGITHRDIKPANVLLGLDGKVKVTDFGLAKVEGDAGITRDDAMVGSPAYMAPEQITGDHLDGRADLFAVGCVLYELASGKQAFDAGNISSVLHNILNEEPAPLAQLRPDLPAGFVAFTERFLAKRAAQRWQSAGEALAALLQYGTAQTGSARAALISAVAGWQGTRPAGQALPPPPAAVSAGPPAKHRGLPWLMVLVPALLLMGLLALTRLPRQPGAMDIPAVQPATPGKMADSLAAATTIPAGPVAPITGPGQSGITPPLRNPARQVTGTTDSTGSRTAPDSNPEPLLSGKVKGHLYLNIEPWADVFVDEHKVDSQAVRVSMELTAGEHTVTLIHPNFPPRVSQITISEAEATSLNWSFLANAAHLDLQVRPWARVYIDNEFKDTTPLKKPLTLAPGSYLLELRHPRANYQERIAISAGDTLFRQISLDVGD